ncbi:hypothetical protein KIPB_002330 [Kipferlia bialata]|uniref:Uncharacterized protein n=1 Tax=Kipferlia bialata TaxID=797122 RepID=A0A9K3CSA7_9EUKA|nr:hypothetical protein KIPB_002330 [Kipferlia bialata]|eukprot:g2330.t1
MDASDSTTTLGEKREREGEDVHASDPTGIGDLYSPSGTLGPAPPVFPSYADKDEGYGSAGAPPSAGLGSLGVGTLGVGEMGGLGDMGTFPSLDPPLYASDSLQPQPLSIDLGMDNYVGGPSTLSPRDTFTGIDYGFPSDPFGRSDSLSLSATSAGSLGSVENQFPLPADSIANNNTGGPSLTDSLGPSLTDPLGPPTKRRPSPAKTSPSLTIPLGDDCSCLSPSPSFTHSLYPLPLAKTSPSLTIPLGDGAGLGSAPIVSPVYENERDLDTLGLDLSQSEEYSASETEGLQAPARLDPTHTLHHMLLHTLEKMDVAIPEDIKEASTGPCVMRALGKKLTMPGGLFALSDLVRSGLFADSFQVASDTPGDTDRLLPFNTNGSTVLTYPILTPEEERSSRYAHSVERIQVRLLRALRHGPQSREQLVKSTGFQRRRLSSALGPTKGAGLLVDCIPDIHATDEGVVLEYVSAVSSSVSLGRAPRLEVVFFAVNSWARYLLALRALRKSVEAELLEEGFEDVSDPCDPHPQWLEERVQEFATVAATQTVATLPHQHRASDVTEYLPEIVSRPQTPTMRESPVMGGLG